jgi:hypothetical protein
MDNPYALAVHFQSMSDGGELAKELFGSGKPFIASIVPNLLDFAMKTVDGKEIYGRIHSPKIYYSNKSKTIFRENRNNLNVIWAQEGYRHCCGVCFNKRENNSGKGYDPYHEHVCLDGHAQSLDEQVEIIGKGKELIKKELGITSIIYCPPNHLYNKDTLEAAKQNGFELFLTRNGFDYFFPNKIELPCYVENGLLVFPETKVGKSPIKMVYYDDNPSDCLNLLSSSSSLAEFGIEDVSPSKIKRNEKLIIISKRIRDFIK